MEQKDIINSVLSIYDPKGVEERGQRKRPGFNKLLKKEFLKCGVNQNI